MFALRYLVLCFGVLAVSLSYVKAVSDEEKNQVKNLVLPFAKECGKEHGITEEDIKAAKEAGTLKDLDPCLAACVLKKIGLFDEKGMFDEEKATEMTKKFISDEDEQNKALEIVHTCASVNDQAVGDGDKGCERAKLMIECFLPLKGLLP